MNRLNRTRNENADDLEAQVAIYALQRSDFVPLFGKIGYLERVQRARMNGTLSHDTRAEQDRTERLLMYYNLAIINAPIVAGALAAVYYFATH